MSSSRSDAVALRAAFLVAIAMASAGCELQEVSIADPEDIIVGEMVLFAGDARQRLVLHRTFGDGDSASVPGARVEVRSQSGATLSLALAPDSSCMNTDSDDPPIGSCYLSPPQPSFVQPARRYDLRIDLANGGRLTGTTIVPDTFTVLRPATSAGGSCRLPADTTLEMRWTRSQGAWVYVVETELRGIVSSLRDRGVTLGRGEPLRLVGLSISESDTTIVFPTELGIFERFDEDVANALLAIRDGLPPAVSAETLVAAADRNYVNWVRGGRFNPSGQVRVPSLRGNGTGMFGSISPRRLRITTTPASNLAPC
ncbi:MAG: hypothetical protein ACREMQ_23620 [Longimicrobiales bacterium]